MLSQNAIRHLVLFLGNNVIGFIFSEQNILLSLLLNLQKADAGYSVLPGNGSLFNCFKLQENLATWFQFVIHLLCGQEFRQWRERCYVLEPYFAPYKQQ